MEKSLKVSLLLAVVTSLLVIGGQLWAVSPLRDAALMAPVSGFALEVSWSYLLFAPLFNLLDLMTSFSVTQHIAWIVTLLLLPLLLVMAKGRAELTVVKMVWKWLVTLLLSLLLIIMLYTLAMLMPRPMSALIAADAEIVLVDFHSHTNYSHDANKFYDAEDNRWWHEHAGFNAAFITDHKSYSGIKEAKLRNSSRARDGVLLLDGIEAYHQTGHVMALCATERNADEHSYEWRPVAGVQSACPPLLVQALPGPIEDSAAIFKQRRISAIELHDGAPLGLEEIKFRSALLRKAEETNIALVSGSDNHGWAYAAIAWSALRISNWQEMNADELAIAITTLIRNRGFAAVQVIERNMLLPASTVTEHLTMPVRLVWHMFRTISLAEALSWLVWSWLLYFVFRKR